MAQAQQNQQQATPRALRTVSQFSERYPAWTQPSIRSLILNADDRLNSRGDRVVGNGLADAGAIVRIGRRVLIDENAFFGWIAAQQKLAARQKTNSRTPESTKQEPNGSRCRDAMGCG